MLIWESQAQMKGNIKRDNIHQGRLGTLREQNKEGEETRALVQPSMGREMAVILSLIHI